MSDKPKVFPAIGYSLLLLIAFVLAASLAGVAAGFVYGLLSVTPLLRAILSNITVTGGSFVALVGAFAGCSLTCWLGEKIISSPATRGLSFVLVGAFIVLIEAYILGCNIITHTIIFPNIVLIISGFIIINSGRSDLEATPNAAPPAPAPVQSQQPEPTPSVQEAASYEDAVAGQRFVYERARNGIMCRIPVEKLSAWREAQQRGEPDKELEKQLDKYLDDLMQGKE